MKENNISTFPFLPTQKAEDLNLVTVQEQGHIRI
jgi:hypothetical protein